MIRGIGVDLASSDRVLRLYTLYGARFLAKAYHPTEVCSLAALSEAARGPFLASRWAVKEALHKALGTKRLLFPDIEISRGPRGQAPPALVLHNAAADYQREQGLALHMTLSHEKNMVVAVVVATTTLPAAAAAAAD